MFTRIFVVEIYKFKNERLYKMPKRKCCLDMECTPGATLPYRDDIGKGIQGGIKHEKIRLWFYAAAAARCGKSKKC